jgi:predicted AlkP superfamily phosphohydrolase/phosphomutase
MKNFDWDFGMIVYRATDLVQHFLWDKEEVFEVYKKVDEEIGKIMSKFEANYFIVSDHGFYGIKKNIFLNNLLYEKGYLVANKKPSSLIIGKMLTRLLYHMPKNFTRLPFMRKLLFSIAFKEKVIDFEKSAAFCLSSSSRAIICRKEIKKEIIELINSFEDDGKKIMKLHEMPSKNDMSYLVAELEEGYAIMDILNFGKVLEKPSKFHFKGEHANHGIFMACGKEIKEWNGSASVIDVMPTVLHSMNLPSPSYIDGEVIDIFKKKRKPKKVEWQKFGFSNREKKIVKTLAKLVK